MRKFWMIICVVLLCMMTGCGNDAAVNENAMEQEEPVWVITEEVSYDENKELLSRVVYQYEKDEYNYRVDSYNAFGELIGYTVQEGDARKTIKSNYMETNRLAVQTVSEFDVDGRLLSKEQKRMEGTAVKQVWNWNDDKTFAEVISTDEKGNVIEKWTEEYDNENRILREKTEQSETTYTYEDNKTISRSDMDGSVYYIVRYYDEQGRLIESRDYNDSDGGDYTEEDMVIHSIQKYKEDGHSLTHEYHIWDEESGEERTGIVEVTYQPLDEVLQSESRDAMTMKTGNKTAYKNMRRQLV